MVRLLTLTGLRRDEVADACWAELGEQVWTIPKERMKSDAAFVVPLTKQMLAIIQALPRFEGSEFLFMARRGNRPVSGFSAMKKRLDRLMVGTAPDWTLHDIRRTFRTRLSRLPVPEGDLVRELMMAHAKPGLHQVYDLEAYLEERRRGCELWAERLMAIVAEPPPER